MTYGVAVRAGFIIPLSGTREGLAWICPVVCLVFRALSKSLAPLLDDLLSVSFAARWTSPLTQFDRRSVIHPAPMYALEVSSDPVVSPWVFGL